MAPSRTLLGRRWHRPSLALATVLAVAAAALVLLGLTAGSPSTTSERSNVGAAEAAPVLPTQAPSAATLAPGEAAELRADVEAARVRPESDVVDLSEGMEAQPKSADMPVPAEVTDEDIADLEADLETMESQLEVEIRELEDELRANG